MIDKVKRFISPAVAIPVLMWLAGCGGPEPIPAPKAFQDFVSPDRTFAGKGPDGWKKSEAGVQGGMQSSVVFEQGTAQVSLTADLQGSLMADIGRANNAQVENVAGMLPEGMQASLPKTIPVIDKLHLAAKNSLAKKYQNYEEKPSQMLRCGMGEGRVSEFTAEKADGIFKYKVHGYRATVLSGERRLVGVLRCAETDWASLSPGFGQILSSLTAGPG
ncbi:MAG: hypothetical protein SFU56_16280 [Capsulimonadales bacterium]|nr:hypothetical protein [Capsulimonadales bacterium]